ncbi:MAG: hypothetical protein HW409_1235 [candidate division NC10 bacterium]|nr:hypothetical protein [candidate division NC10 bacterium]
MARFILTSSWPLSGPCCCRFWSGLAGINSERPSYSGSIGTHYERNYGNLESDPFNAMKRRPILNQISDNLIRYVITAKKLL